MAGAGGKKEYMLLNSMEWKRQARAEKDGAKNMNVKNCKLVKFRGGRHVISSNVMTCGNVYVCIRLLMKDRYLARERERGKGVEKKATSQVV